MGTLAGLVLGIVSAHAVAAEPTSLALNFVGTADCSERSVLIAEVERRSEAVHWVEASASGDPGTVTVDARIEGSQSHYKAAIVVQKPAQAPISRSITGSTCREVVDGAALIIAVLLPSDPQDKQAPRAPIVRRPEPPPVKQQPPRTWSVVGGVTGLLLTGVAPAVLPGIELAFGIQSSNSGWAPALRLGVRYASRSGFSTGNVDEHAGFRLTTAIANACPLAFRASDLLTLRPCLSGAYGTLKAEGVSLTGSVTDSHPWAAVGGGLRLEAQVHPALGLELESTTEVTLFTSRFWMSGVNFHETTRPSQRFAVTAISKF